MKNFKNIKVGSVIELGNPTHDKYKLCESLFNINGREFYGKHFIYVGNNPLKKDNIMGIELLKVYIYKIIK